MRSIFRVGVYSTTLPHPHFVKNEMRASPQGGGGFDLSAFHHVLVALRFGGTPRACDQIGWEMALIGHLLLQCFTG